MRLIFISWILLLAASLAEDSTTMLPGAHAHNDYLHDRPLQDALTHGFQSVEADIYLVDGKLLVAHDLDKVTPERTLQSLYLDPLAKRVREHPGQVYAGSESPFYLLIDFKSEGESTYRALHAVLIEYQEMLTQFEADKIQQRAVTVIVSGNRPAELLASLEPRIAGCDGRMKDLETADPHFIPWISDNWGLHFKWRGKGPLSDADGTKLKDIIAKAHARKLQVRFWAIPDQKESWKVMRDYGVDFINTDQLGELSAFLRAKP